MMKIKANLEAKHVASSFSSKNNKTMPDSVDAGWSFFVKNNLQKAIDIFKKHPNNQRACIGLARCYQKMNRYRDALDIYLNSQFANEKAIQINLARCYQEMSRYQDALRIYLKPEFAKDKVMQESLAYCYREMNQHQDALAI